MTLAGYPVASDCSGLVYDGGGSGGPFGAQITQDACCVHPHPQGPLFRELGCSTTLLIKLNVFIKCQGSRLVLPPTAPSAEACAWCASQEPESPIARGLGVILSL